MSQPEILVVEDEEDILHLLYFNLCKAGFKVRTAVNGKDALREVEITHPHLILLDLMLPGINGYDVCLSLKEKKKTRHIPIIMVTAKDAEADIIKGLETGADDYIPKPFSPKVLIARINAVLRRHQMEGTFDRVDVSRGGFVIHSYEHKFTFLKKELDLAPLEYQFLELLIRKPGRVFTRNQIVNAYRGEDYAVTERSVDVLVVGLRKKLRAIDPAGHEYIETVRGVGYRIRGSEED